MAEKLRLNRPAGAAEDIARKRAPQASAHLAKLSAPKRVSCCTSRAAGNESRAALLEA